MQKDETGGTIMKENKKKLSRRDFLKGTAAAALSLSALPLLHVQASAASDDTISWDYEADVVVVGTGTVAVGAVAAVDSGAESVIVLEKDKGFFGGTSATSGGGFAFPAFIDFLENKGGDTRETCLAYMKACGEGRMDDRAMTTFVDVANEFANWFIQIMGWERFGYLTDMFDNYYPLYTNGTIPGRGCNMIYDKDGNRVTAFAIWSAIRAYLESHEQVTLMMGTAGQELIQNSEGRVIGIYADQDGKRLAIRAKKGVLLGTGGFDYNETMRRQYLPTPIFRSVASRNNTGDGQKMSARIGAQLAYMDRVMGAPYVYDEPEWNESNNTDYSIIKQDPRNYDFYTYYNMAHSMLVNRKGWRFGNENRHYDVTARAFGGFDTGNLINGNLPGIFVCDSQVSVLPTGVDPAGELPEYIFKFDSLEELADGMGVDRENLLMQVARFNESVKNGEDKDFARDAATLGTIEQAPFFACRYVPGSMNTRGGLQVDENSQVVNQDNEAIPGLYAIGNCSTGVAGYWAGGACISQGCVMAYVAAKAALKN